MGFFGFGKKEKDKLKTGLEKTRTGFWGSIMNTLTGSVIDDDVDAHALGDGPQNGHQQNCDGGTFHEGAEDQQDDGHDQAEQGLVQVH